MKVLSLLLISICLSTPAWSQQAMYLNPKEPIEKRVNDLVSKMTLAEKVSQMQHKSPAIARLGIPQYDWWNEALHGVARNGLATSFPQAIGMAATWNKRLMYEAATVISDEGRAKYNIAIAKGQHGEYQGLTFWSPNVNIFRDPRWGRGQETYGEDPFLTGTMAVQFIKGMQGNDPKYMKVIATAKHFAVHSGPESERHKFNAEISEYDLRETYLPAFKMCVMDGKAGSLMCAYNSIRGKACCGNDPLLNNILRNEWGFKGYVVSDCGAIRDIYGGHKQTDDAASASAVAVKAGTDLECGEVYEHLTKAVKAGLITEDEIDVSVRRLFTARMKLGMFDPADSVPYSHLGAADVDSKSNHDKALQMARESIVLLKNQNGALPLSPNLKTIAVIGPNANDSVALLGNYEGSPSHTVTLLEGIRKGGFPETKILWEPGCSLAIKSRSEEDMNNRAIEAAKKADVVIMCMGLSPSLEGEEMDVKVEGFVGGDRTTLDLPSTQQNLIKKIVALGKPVVLVLVNGSALAINWENDNIPAIVEAWYGGQAAGTAVADVLFGNYNPSGKLPVTFYKSLSQLPDFKDYNMKNRTYRYFTGDVLYPFGYGLSYSSFEISGMNVLGTIKGKQVALITVDITNTGTREGQDVIEMYVKGGGTDPAIKTLRGFEKVSLKPGETTSIEFSITPELLTFYREGIGYALESGEHTILIGSSSADKDLKEIKVRVE